MSAHAFQASDLTYTLVNTMAAAEKSWRYLETYAVATPFQRYDWLSSFQNSEHRCSTKIVIAFAGDLPVMLFPLAVEREFGARRLRFLNDQYNDYNAPLIVPKLLASIDGDQARAILERVVSAVGDVDYYALTKQPEQLGLWANPFARAHANAEATSAHVMRLSADCLSTASQRFSKETMRKHRAKERRLTASGALAYRILDDGDEKAAAIALMMEWKCQQLDAAGSRNPFSPESLASLENFGRHGGDSARVHSLELDSAPIAVILALPCDGGILMYQQAYDQGHSRNSPGRILLHRLIDDLVAKGEPLLNFGNGDEGYKAEFCEEKVLLTRGIKACRPAGIVPALIEQVELAGKRLIKAQPNLMAALSWARLRWSAKRDSSPQQTMSSLKIGEAAR